MKRVHLFEIEDQTWFPEFLRNYVTDYLRFATNLLKLYHPALDVLNRYVHLANGRVIDLASGGGGPWIELIPELTDEHPQLDIHLTDFYPNKKAAAILSDAFPDVVQYDEAPVDARDVPSRLKGLRTQFLSLHHFRPKDVEKIFRNATEAGEPILIMEGQQRNLLNVLKIALSPIPALLIMPLIRPFSIGRLIFTYLIPIVPFVIGFDGVISVLRTYTIAELKELARKADPSNKFIWEGGRIIEKGKVVLWFGGHRKSM